MVRTTMTSLIILCTLLVAQIDPSEAFTTPLGRHHAVCSKTNARSIIGFSTVFSAASSDNEANGDPDKAPPSPPTPVEFSTDEIQEMETLILDLSKEKDDDLRRQKLADILDKELVTTTEQASSDDSSEVILPQEVPRFAQLFQYSLDIVGENVQNAAREKAMELNENSLHVIEDSTGTENVPGTGSDRIKSDEELQLWALIDMMVQSKTRVKLYMGR